jgi:hypothetical protein
MKNFKKKAAAFKGKAAGAPAAFVASENPGVDHPAATAASFMS